MRKLLAFIAVAGFLCTGAMAAEQNASHEDLMKLLDALQQAGLKVTADDTQQTTEEKADTEALREEAEFDKIVEKLKSVTMSVDYQDAPLAAVLADLQKTTGVNFVLDPKALAARPANGEKSGFFGSEEAKEPTDLQVNLKLKDVKAFSVLGNILRMYDLMAVYSNEALMVTLPQQEEPITLIYDVAELTAPKGFSFPSKRLLTGLSSTTNTLGFVVEEDQVKTADLVGKDPKQTLTGKQLVELLVKATPNGHWNDNRRIDSVDDAATLQAFEKVAGTTVSWTTEVYSIIYTDGMLVVTQTPDVQMSIANILTALKSRR